MRGRRSELGGATAIITALVLPLIAVILVAVLELGCAYTTHTAYRDDLALSVEMAEQPWFDLELKNSETPGYDLSEQIARGLRENGFEGSVSVWVAERDLAAEGLGNYRAIAFYVYATGEYKPLSAVAFSDASIDISVSECDYILPYSSNTAWKPADASSCNGKWQLEAGKTTAELYRAAEEETPQEVVSALESRLDAAQEQAAADSAQEGIL